MSESTCSNCNNVDRSSCPICTQVLNKTKEELAVLIKGALTTFREIGRDWRTDDIATVAELAVDELIRHVVDKKHCQYSDCVEQHPVAPEGGFVTCNTCRDSMGLEPLGQPVPMQPAYAPEPPKDPSPSTEGQLGLWKRVGNSMAIRNTMSQKTLLPGDPGYHEAQEHAEGWDPNHPAPDPLEPRSIHDKLKR